VLTKAFRLFVSSTFSDFAAERDVLQKEVFPALDAYCATEGYQFYPLDLRWGVNEEAQLDHRTTEICLNEVRTAKQDYPPPNFLILIGNRYGFVPLPYAIAQDEFEAILAWLEGGDGQNAARAIRSVYQQDHNYLVPPGLSEAAPDRAALISAYTLRSRADDRPELKAVDAWARREAELRAALQEAADGLLSLGRIDAAAHEKYFLSLTDQEIIHGLPGYRPAADGASPRSRDADGPPAIAFIREIVTQSTAPPAAIGRYFEQAPRLDALKETIKRTLSADQVITARATVDEHGRFSAAYLADFAHQIQGKLQSAIDRYIAAVETLEQAPDHALTRERATHRAFGEQKLEVFVGQERELAAIARYLAGAGDHPLIVHSRSGLGKSALMARAIALAESADRAPVIARFVGASAASSNLRALLVSVIEDLAAHDIVALPVDFEQDAHKLNAQIEELLSSTTRPAVVFLDALDQLQRPHDLGWLPETLPETLRLVLSVLDDADYEADSDLYRDLQNRLAPDAFLAVDPLGLTQARDILSALEQQTRHQLQDGQRNYIIEKLGAAGASPLYLTTAFEIARSWKSYHTAGAGRFVLADDTKGVIAQLIEELSSVHHHETELVTRILGYLAAARNGLSAKELTDVLSRDAGVMRAISSERHGALTDRLPPSVWVRLNRDLSSFLVEKQIDDQPLLQFFHRQVTEVVREQHYGRCKTELHAALAVYFESQASERDGKTVHGKRGLSELPFQLDAADDALRLGEILMSPDWMQQKVAAFGPRPLIEDYHYARTRAQQLAGQALELATGSLARDHCQLVAQIVGRLTPDLADEVADATEIERLLANARALVAPPALVPRWPSFTVPGGPEIHRFEGHGDAVSAAVFSTDGRHIVSASEDGSLRQWEVGSGREIARFVGVPTSEIGEHLLAPDVTAIAFSPDRRRIVCGGANELLLWEPAIGESRRFSGHTKEVSAVAFSSDGGRIVSGSWDHTVRLWEVASAREIARFEGHTAYVRTVAFSPDGQYIVSGSQDKTVRLWEVASGREIIQLERPGTPKDLAMGSVNVVAFFPDGSHIVCCSSEGTVRLWEAESGEFWRVEDIPRVHAVAFSPDGRHIVLGSEDNAVWLWEVASGAFRRLEGHTDTVSAVAFSPDGRYIVSGSWDQTLRLWQVASARPHRVEDHTNTVNAVAFSLDGEKIISASSGEDTLRLWQPASGKSRPFEGPGNFMNVRAVSLGGRYIVTYSEDYSIGGYPYPLLRLWELPSGSEIGRCDGRAEYVETVVCSPDGRYVVGCSQDFSLRLWEMASGSEIARFEGHTLPANAVAFSPDGQYIVSCSWDKTVRLWEVARGRESARIKDRPDWDGIPEIDSVLRRTLDTNARLWEASAGESWRFEGHIAGVSAVAFSPDGRHIVSGSSDRTVRLLELASGSEIARFEGHTGGVNAVAFSPDGRHIASGSDDRTVRLWDVANLRELARLEGEDAFNMLVFAPHRTSVVAAGGGLHLIDILVDESDKAIWLRALANGRS
jgi:WD40 repeat protein